VSAAADPDAPVAANTAVPLATSAPASAQASTAAAAERARRARVAFVACLGAGTRSHPICASTPARRASSFDVAVHRTGARNA
jgi:hypothetical protein